MDRHRLRLVHIDTGRDLRGGQRQLLRLAGRLHERGWRQLIVTPESSALEEQARSQGLALFTLPAKDIGHAHGILQMRQQWLAAPVDLIHAHDGRGQTLSWLASWGLGIRRVASRRVTFLPGAVARHRFIYGRTCHAVIAVSQEIRRILLETGVPAERVEVIADGIEIPPSTPTPADRHQARRALGLEDSSFVVGQVGAFTPEKGHDITLASLHLLASAMPGLRVLFLGGLPSEGHSQFQVKVDSLGGCVRLLPPREELFAFFAALDLLIMPSRAEGLGSGALLAMAHGVPVAASRVGGLPEIVSGGENGWLFEPGSAAALARTVQEASTDRTRLQRYGVAARARAMGFSDSIMIERTEALYCRLLGEPLLPAAARPPAE